MPRPGQVTELGVEASFWPGKQTRGTVLCCISGQRQQPALSLPGWRLTRGPTSHLPHTLSLATESCSNLCPTGTNSRGIALPQARSAPQVLTLSLATQCSHGRPRWLSGKEPTCQCQRCRFNPWVGKIPWRRAWQPSLVFLPGESHGYRSLVGYSP